MQKNFLNSYSLSKNRPKKGRKKVKFWIIFFVRKNSKPMVFILKLNWGRCLHFRCHLDMGCMESGRKEYSKFVTKISIFTYSTRVHLDSTLNHSKSCRRHIFVHSVQFWGQTDVIWRSWKNNSKMMIFTKKIHHRPFESYKISSANFIGLVSYFLLL